MDTQMPLPLSSPDELPPQAAHVAPQAAEAPGGAGDREMRVATLTEPWATLMRLRAKRLETRSGNFARHYRGECAIQAAKGWPKNCRALCAEEPFYSVLRFRLGAELGLAADAPELQPGSIYKLLLPTLGHIIALGRISATFWADELMEQNRKIQEAAAARPSLSLRLLPQPVEEAFGNYGPGRLALEFQQVRPLARPEPVIGNLGLWRLNGLQASRVRRAALAFDVLTLKATHRAGGEVVCDLCGRLYSGHPAETEVLSDQGHPFLVRGCNGELLKL